jgi:hypothetical protein
MQCFFATCVSDIPEPAVVDDLLPVHVQPRPPYLAALQLRPAHARPHALDDDATLQLRHRGHDDDDGPGQRALGVDRLALRENWMPNPASALESSNVEKKRGNTRDVRRYIYMH